MTQIPAGGAATVNEITPAKRRTSTTFAKTTNPNNNNNNNEDGGGGGGGGGGSVMVMLNGSSENGGRSTSDSNHHRRFSTTFQLHQNQNQSQQQTSASPMIISVERSPTDAAKPNKPSNNKASTRIFQQRINVDNNPDSSTSNNPDSQLPPQGNNNNNRSKSSSVSMILPNRQHSSMNNGNGNGNGPESSVNNKKMIQVDLLNRVDFTTAGGHKAVIREDASLVAVAMANQRMNNPTYPSNQKSSIGANSFLVADADVSTISMAIPANGKTAHNNNNNNNSRGVTKSEVSYGKANNGNNRGGVTVGVATFADSGAVFARVATVPGVDGLAHFEKDDYERFVEDRQRAILYGTLPNRLEDALVNAAFSAFISKLKQLEAMQKAKSNNANSSHSSSSAAAAALAVQHRLEAIDDNEGDFIVFLHDDSRSHQNQQSTGRQAGGQNQQQLFRRISRPQTRGGAQPAPPQSQKGPGSNTTKSQTTNLLTSKQPLGISNSRQVTSLLQKEHTVLTGQGINGQRGTGSTITPHNNSNTITNGRNSTLPQSQQMPQNGGGNGANGTVTGLKKIVTYHSNASVVPTTSSMFPFPTPPSNVIYNMSRKDYAGSKLSLPVISAAGASAASKVPPHQLKIVNVNFHQQLKIDESYPAASPNH